MKGTAAIKQNHGIIYNIDRKRKNKNTTQRRNTQAKKTVRMKKRIKTLTKDYNKGC
jgi:hypothetical protein